MRSDCRRASSIRFRAITTRGAEVDELQDQVQVARQVGGVDDGDDHVGAPVEQAVAGDPLVFGDRVERIGAGQVDELRPPARASWPRAMFRPTVMPG